MLLLLIIHNNRCFTYIIIPSIKSSFEVDQKTLFSFFFLKRKLRLERFSYLSDVTLQGSAGTSRSPESVLSAVNWSVSEGGGSDENR